MQAQGEFARVTQSIEKARQTAGQPVKRGTMAHEHHVYLQLSEAAVQQRDAEALRQWLPRFEELASRDEHRLFLAIAQRARGVAHRLGGEHAEAEEHLGQALELFSQMGTHWQLGRTHFEMGETAVSRGDAEAARQHYQNALAEFEALQAMPDLAHTRQALQYLD
jgi:tetratricopeptide (TPR) repeat protein